MSSPLPPGATAPPHFVGIDLAIEAQPVPVPASLLLVGSGLLGLAGLRHRRRS
ncbi:MAG: VPLPA-CTERM sorting domain-containing protein [Thermodesulfobacteriota bacterium]